eukprot:317999-Chlamydomonas_euryale.AAC.1
MEYGVTWWKLAMSAPGLRQLSPGDTGITPGARPPAARTQARAFSVVFAAGTAPLRIENKRLLMPLRRVGMRARLAIQCAQRRPSLAPPSPPSPSPRRSLALPRDSSAAAGWRPEGGGG